MNKIDLKKLIIEELESESIPDLRKLFVGEALDLIPEILLELLEERKEKFQKLLETPDEKIDFMVFEDEERLHYLFELLTHYESVCSNEKLQKIIEDFQPLYVEFSNEVSFNKRFYEMHLICRDNCELDSDQKRIIDLSIRDFEHNGIHLPEEKKLRLKEINQKLSELSFQFGKNLLESEKNFSYFLEDKKPIEEMHESDLETARKRALEDGKEGWKFLSDEASYLSIMKFCSDPKIRKHFYLSRFGFASDGDNDNRPLILEILKLRKEEADILGFDDYSEYSLHDKMAGSREKVLEMIMKVHSRGIEKAKKDLDELRKFSEIEKMNIWDVSYFGTKMKEKLYDLDENMLRDYFEFEKVLEGLFLIAKELYDLEFKELDFPRYADGVRAYEVHKDGKMISYYFLDPFYRGEKSSGAWASIMRETSPISKKKKIIYNVCGFLKGSPLTLLNIREAETLFHEFGHALHNILSESIYGELSGTFVELDFVELPSQLMEYWCNEYESLDRFAKHHETGEKIPDEILKKLHDLKTFNSGVQSIWHDQLAMIDMELHGNDLPQTVEELDQKVLDISRSMSIFQINEGYKIHSGFTHLFVWGYGAGYYSYRWSEIIEADIFSEFKKNGMFDKETSKRFLDKILVQGARKPARELFRDFMGRDMDYEAFYKKQGF